MFIHILLFLLPLASADCSFTNQQLTIPNGSWYEICCFGLDGKQDVSYKVVFASVNNDNYSTQSIVADDSGHTGVCGQLEGGPTPYWYGTGYTYHDNFDHSEYYHDTGSGGTYITVQESYRINCLNPGSGDTCQVVLKQVALCAGEACGFDSDRNMTSEVANGNRTHVAAEAVKP